MKMDLKHFCVNVNFPNKVDLPHSIGFSQLKGDFVVIGYENGAYSIFAFTEIEAIKKAFNMMSFINNKTESLNLDSRNE